MEVLEKIQPLYTVYYYTDFLYRVVKFKRNTGGISLREFDDSECPLDKFAQSYCRARSMVLQYSLCNEWDYFITITVSPEKFDRYELDPIAKSLKQWFLDYGKKYGVHIWFVLVPELHQDGAWHFHGLVRGIPARELCFFPDDKFRPSIKKLHDNGYLNWPALMRKIGFCSLSPIKSAVGVGFYITKYITKQNARSGFYEHLYYCSRGLNTARPVADCYLYEPTLENCLEFDNDFCACGWVRDADWTFPMDDVFEPRFISPDSFWGSIDSLVPVSESDLENDTKLSFVQLTLADWLEFSF